jgi:Domain of unknown function (DUF4111)/Nucleotidyltransferase domain
VDSKTVSLPDEVVTVMSAYLRMVDARLPSRVSGLYLVGSLALDDYRPGQSDIDFVTVTDRAFTPSELTQLGQIHRELRRTRKSPALDGIYVTWSELQAEPRGLAAPYCLDGRFFPSGGFAANPVTWSTVLRHPVPVRGPANPDVWHDDEALRQWCRENLQSYWANWVYEARHRFVRRLYSCLHQAVVWGVLGVTRLHATIKTGEIVSKTAAGTYALEAFPARWSPIIEEALGGRLGPPVASRRSLFARRRDALAFMEYVISDAA